MRLNGGVPAGDWDGQMLCQETDAAQTFRTNETQGFIRCYSFTLVTAGWLTLVYQGRELTFRPDDLFTYSPGMGVTIVAASEDYRGFCLMAEEDVVFELPMVRHLIRLHNAPIVNLQLAKRTLPAGDARQLRGQMQQFIRLSHLSHPYRNEMLRLLCASILLYLTGLPDMAGQTRHIGSRAEDLFMDFIRMLPRYFTEHHDIRFYADRLHVTPVYLSRVVRQVAGRTVVDYINQMLVMEAQWLLHSSTDSVAQIADRLHFADTASFSKFFSRMQGLPPREYRRSR